MTEKQREWLLVLVSTGKQSVLTEMAKKLNKSTYDKIKTEFTTHKKEGFDRCFELRIPETGKGDVVSKRAFDDLLTKMKKCVGRTLSQHVSFYKEEVAKLHEMRHTPGWNYCNFFVTKVGGQKNSPPPNPRANNDWPQLWYLGSFGIHISES